MAKITRFNGNVRPFAADALGTERTVFGDTAQSDTLDANITADFLRGWGIVAASASPTKQDFNGLGFTLGSLIAYLHQMGIAEWNGAQEYHTGSLTNRAGVIYRCLTDNHISVTPPESDATNWKAQLDAAELLALIKTVDGSGSGLDADLFRGEAPSAFSKYGVGQSWVVLPGRTAGVDYQNTTGNTIEVMVDTASGGNIEVSSDGVTWKTITNSGAVYPTSFNVPDQHYYRVTASTISTWAELR